MQLLEGIQTTAQDSHDNQERRLQVCAIGPQAFGGLTSQSVSRVARAFPNFNYTQDQKPRIEIEDWIIAGHADGGLTLLPTMRERMLSRVFARTRGFAMLPVGHPLADWTALSPVDFADQLVFLPQQSVRFRVLIEAAVVRAGLTLRAVCETPKAISMAHVVAEGMAICAVDPFALMDNSRGLRADHPVGPRDNLVLRADLALHAGIAAPLRSTACPC